MNALRKAVLQPAQAGALRSVQPNAARSFASRSALSSPLRSDLSSPSMTSRGFASQTSIPAAELVSMSTLPNGVRVATDATPGHFQAMGVYVDTGSRFERQWIPGEAGSSHLLDRLAYKSTANRTFDQMQADINKVGGNIMASSSREAIMYQASMFSKSLPEVFSILADTVNNPTMSSEELDAQREATAWEVAEIQNKPEMIIPEILHSIAYKDNTLGNPLLCPLESLELMTNDNVRNFMKTWYTPDRIVVAGAGMTHEELFELTQQYFGHLKKPEVDILSGSAPSISAPSSSRSGLSRSSSLSSLFSSAGSAASSASSASGLSASMNADFSTAARIAAQHAPSGTLPETRAELAATSAVYKGGQLYLPRDDLPFTHVYVAFETPSVMDDDIYALATMQILLGGGGSFSAGGPGKGMYSRLYTNVLNQYHAVDYCAAFHHCYADSGIFGIAASVRPDFNRQIPQVIARELDLLTEPNSRHGVSKQELERAKNQLKSSLVMTLESRLVQVEDLGRQVQVHGRRVSVDEMCRKIDEVDIEKLCSVARRVLRPENATMRPLNNGLGSGQSTVVAMGNLDGLPDVQQVLAKRGLGLSAYY